MEEARKITLCLDRNQAWGLLSFSFAGIKRDPTKPFVPRTVIIGGKVSDEFEVQDASFGCSAKQIVTLLEMSFSASILNSHY